MKNKSKKKWKERWIVVRQRKQTNYSEIRVYQSTKMRTEYQNPVGILALHSYLSVYLPKECSYPHVFVVEGPDEVIYLSAKSDEERDVWMNTIQSLEIFDHKKLGNFCFTVTGTNLPDMARLGVCGDRNYNLIITQDELIITLAHTSAVLAKWPLVTLRKYWFEYDVFSIHSGSKSPRGPGEYSFKTNQSEEIFETLDKVIEQKARMSTNPLSPSVDRPPVLPPKDDINASKPQPSSGTELMQYHEINDDIRPQVQPISNPPALGENIEYARTQHNLGNYRQPTVSKEKIDPNMYSTLAHGDKLGTWRSASIDSKAQYEMAKHSHNKNPSAGEYSIAYKGPAAGTHPIEIPPSAPPPPKEVSPLTSPNRAQAKNPTYEPAGEVVKNGEDQSSGTGNSKPFKSTLLNTEGKPLTRTYSEVRKDKTSVKQKIVEVDPDDSDSGTDETPASKSPPELPARAFTKSECEELHLSDEPPKPPPRQPYSKSECDELMLSTTPTTPIAPPPANLEDYV